MWKGNDGSILSSSFLNNSATEDSGVYVDGGNNIVKDSILISSSQKPVIYSASYVVTANYNWWGNTLHDYTQKPNAPTRVNVKNWLFLNSTADKTSLKVGEMAAINLDLSYLITSNGVINRYDAFNLPVINLITETDYNLSGFVNLVGGFAKVDYVATHIPYGSLTIKLYDVREILNFSIEKGILQLNVSEFVILNGNLLVTGQNNANGTVHVLVNNKDYSSDMINGKAFISITDLPLGTYLAATSFESEDYDADIFNSYITIKSSIYAMDLIKTQNSNSKFQATFYDFNGNVLKNTKVTFMINNGLKTSITNNDGVATLDVNLPIGNYPIISLNPVTDESINNVITIIEEHAPILNTIITASNITTVYKSGEYLVATLRDANGSTIEGVVLSVNLNGVKNYITDKKGTIKVPTIDLTPKSYVANIAFAGNENYAASNTNANVIILQAPVDLAASYTVSALDDGFSVNIIINTNPVINDNLFIKFNGEMYPIEVVNGVAKFTSNKVYSNTYNTGIFYVSSDGYNSSTTVNAVVKSTKVTQLNTFTYYYYNNDMGSDSEKGISKIKVVDIDGNPIKNGVVTITIMNKYKLKVKTDANGVAKFTKAYKPGTYSVTAKHDNKVTKLGNLVLKSVVNLPKVSKVSKSAKTTTIKITLKGTGPIKGKTVVVSFMKVNYKLQTDNKGVALFKVTKDMVSKLAVGKTYTVRATYRMDSVAHGIQILK